MEFSYLHTGSKQFLSSGIESRANEVFSSTIRKAIVKELNFLFAAEVGDKTSAAEYF